jgi:hypothetical protein
MHRPIATVALAAVVVACGGSAPTAAVLPTNVPTGPSDVASSTPTLGDPRVVGWNADIDRLLEQLERMHPNFDEQVDAARLRNAANALRETVATATDDELLVGVMRLVAMVSAKGCDAHTGAFVWGGGSYAVRSLPVRLWLFGDEVRIVDAMAPYEALIGASIDAIDGVAIADVLARVDPIVPRDNSQTVRLLMPRFLLIPQVLRGLGIRGGTDVRLTTTTEEGEQLDTDVAPIAMPSYNSWAGAYGLHLPSDANVLYLSRIDDVLWWQELPDGTLLVQYNQVVANSLGDLQQAIDELEGHEIVLDLRHNFGGEVSSLDPMVSAIAQWLGRDDANHLTVATARNTFSAASLLVARLAELPNVDIAGEAMGGCPSGWGNSRDFNLSYSGIPISVATTFEVGASADDSRTTIEPDVPRELTFADWRARRDPILDEHFVVPN